MKFQTNQVLAVCRLPFYLWTPVNGGRELFDNPGTSLMSYVSSRSPAPFIQLPQELHEAYGDCFEFTTLAEHRWKIVNHLAQETSRVTEEALRLPGDALAACKQAMGDSSKRLIAMMDAAKELVDKLCDGDSNGNLVLADLESIEMNNFVQSTIDLLGHVSYFRVLVAEKAKA